MFKQHIKVNRKLFFYIVIFIVTVLFLVPVPEQAASTINDKLIHGLVFFGLMWLIHCAYPQMDLLSRLAVILIAYGLVIELLQGQTDHRSFSIQDLFANTTGVVICLIWLKYRSVRQIKF